MRRTKRWAATLAPTRWHIVWQFLLATLLPLVMVLHVDPTTPATADARLYDRVMGTFPRPPKSDIQIIAIDDESIERIGPWPWPQSVHTQFLQQLARQKPKAVVLDFRLGEPQQTPEDDVALTAALKLAPVYVEARNDLNLITASEAAGVRLRTKRLAPVVAGAGHANLVPDAGTDRLRFIRLFAGAPDALKPYVGALVDPSPAVQRAVAKAKPLCFGIPLGAAHSSVSYVEVLEGKLEPHRLEGRTVVVGPSLDSAFGVPMYLTRERGPTLVSSAEVHATAIDALQQGTQVSVAGPFVLYTCTAFLIWTLFFAFDKMARVAPLVGVAVIVLGVIWSVAALRVFRVWMPPSFFVVAVVASYVLWTWQHLHKVLGFLKAHIVSLSRVPAGNFDPVVPFALGGSDTIDRYIGALEHAIARLLRLQMLTRQGLEQLPIAIVLCRADGTVAQLNAAALALLPEPPPGLPSLVDEALVSIIARLEVKANIRPAVRDAHWSQALGGEYVTPQGKIFQIDATRLGDAMDPGPATWVVVLRELTRQRQAERERADWLNFLWHDLRSPQINLLSLLELFEMAPSRVGVAELVAGVRHEAERTMTLAQNFISDSTADARDYQFAIASVSSLLAESIAALSSAATARGVRVVLRSVQDHHDLMRADGGMLTRAFVNMLENAIRHSPSGATIRVCCGVEESLEAVVTIQDDGTGMAPAKLDELLDRQAGGDTDAEGNDTASCGSQSSVEAAPDRAPPRDPKHGFGFVMVRQVVSAHGGWVSGWSMAGVGTTFAIGFPLVHA